MYQQEYIWRQKSSLTNIGMNQMKEENDLKIALKDDQLSHVAKLYKQVCDSNSRIENDNKLLNENLKILKKAVTIQDTRLREISQQNQQQEVTISNLNEYIHKLETQLLSSTVYSQSGFYFPPPPPDVF